MKKTNKYLIAVTGQTGSGKTALCAMLAERGFSVVSADRMARLAVEKGSECLRELAEAFGPGILTRDGALDRTALAAKAFGNPEKTTLLNRITHPHIMKLIRAEIAARYEQGAEAVVLEVPLLKESGIAAECDAIVVVTADAELRRKRIMARDGLSLEKAELRMNTQKPYEDEQAILFDNSGDPESMKRFASELTRSLKEKWNLQL